MPRLLIAGCGYLGQALADLLMVDGWEVEGWTMSLESAERLSGKPYQVRAVDVASKEQVTARKSDFDAIIHCASTRGGDIDSYRRVYFEGARNLIERFHGSRILFTSSTSVYAQKHGEFVTETSPAEPQHETGKVLRRAEELVLAAGGVVGRVAGIYGPGRSALLKKFLKGEAIIDPEHDRFVNSIHRDDAAAAFRLLLEGQLSAGQLYNVVDNEPSLRSEWYKWLAAKLNRPVQFVGRSIGRSISKRKRGESNKRVSNAKLRALGWSLRYPTFVEGMEESVLSSFDLQDV